jgi:hypothetical protein
LSHYLKNHRDTIAANGPFAIKFPKSEISNFDKYGFETFFLPIFLRKQIILPFEKAKEFSLADNYNKNVIGVRCLMRQHSSNTEIWYIFLYLILNRQAGGFSNEILYYLAHIPGHPDIFYFSGSMPSERTKMEIRAFLSNFDQEDVIKLLKHINSEDGISRGSAGQNVEAIISIIPHKIDLLEGIMSESGTNEDIRRWAALLCAHYLGSRALPVFERHSTKDPGFVYFKDIVNHLKEEGFVYLY